MYLQVCGTGLSTVSLSKLSNLCSRLIFTLTLLSSSSCYAGKRREAALFLRRQGLALVVAACSRCPGPSSLTPPPLQSSRQALEFPAGRSRPPPRCLGTTAVLNAITEPGGTAGTGAPTGTTWAAPTAAAAAPAPPAAPGRGCCPCPSSPHASPPRPPPPPAPRATARSSPAWWPTPPQLPVPK